MLYFAYGSNMNQERMKSRKTDFEFRTGAVLSGYELVFNKRAGYSKSYGKSLYPSHMSLKSRKTLWEDKTKYISTAIEKRPKFVDPDEGYANIIKNPDSIVQGALYVIPESGLKKLDSCEGYPTHYDREILKVTCTNGAVVDAIVYIANPNQEGSNLLPSDTYLAHLLKGADIMSSDYFQKLANQKTVSEFGNKGYSSTSNYQYPYSNYNGDHAGDYGNLPDGYDSYGNYVGYGRHADDYWKNRKVNQRQIEVD